MPPAENDNKKRGECIGIVSGKGGAGKSILTVNLGAALARMGKRVLCVDCAAGARGLDLALGLSDASAMNFTDVAMGRCELNQAVIAYPEEPGLYLLNAPPRGIVSWTPDILSETGMENLINNIRENFDICLLDAAPGPGLFDLESVTSFANRVIVISLIDPIALRDAQKTVMRLQELYPGRFPDGDINLIINRIRLRILYHTRMTIDDAMDQAGLPLLGLIPEDDCILRALYFKQPVTIAYPSSRAAYAIRNIAARLTGKSAPLTRMPW